MFSYWNLILLVIISLNFAACNVEPEEIKFGKDDCNYCKMKIMDSKFGAEIVTNKGKVYKFDDVNCMVRHIKDNNINQDDLKYTLIINYVQPKTLIDAKNAYYLRSESITSPMGSYLAAFEKNNYSDFIKKWNAEEWKWDMVFSKFN